MKKNNKVNPLTHFNNLKAAAVKRGQAQMSNFIKKMSLGGPPEGEQPASPAAAQGTKSSDEIAKDREKAEIAKYANMSRKDFRKEKQGARRIQRLNAIKSGDRAERTGKIIDAVGNVANAASTIVSTASNAKDAFGKQQKLGGSVKRKRK